MELVYLWVEDYKNIGHQGFNFSPRFDCKFDEEKNELEIIDKEETKEFYPKNFFGDNINLTAIVGENGSGKSSLIEQLLLLFFKSTKQSNIASAWILTYENEQTCLDLKYYNYENHGFNTIKINNEKIRENSTKNSGEKYFFYSFTCKKKPYQNLFYNPSIELVSSSFLDFIHDGLKDQDASIYDFDFKPDDFNIFAFPSKKNRIIDIKKNENTAVLNMFKTLENFKSKNIDFQLDKFLNNQKLNFIPSKIECSFDLKDTKYLIKRDEKVKEVLFSQYYGLDFKSIYAYFITSILSIAIEHPTKEGFSEYFFEEGEIKKYLQNLYDEQKKQIPENDTVSSPIYKLIKYVLNHLDEFIEFTSTINLANSIRKDSKLNADILYTAQLLEVLKKLDNENILDNHQIRDRETIVKILSAIPSYIRVDAYDQNEIKFNDFSFGEKNLITLIYSLVYYINYFDDTNTTINIFIDEMETGSNPKWQKELMSILLFMFEKFNIPLNIIISSHSPFILSDLPKENVIFLEKDENGNCKNVTKETNIKTFGANIHTLLSHGFFMKDGLMGEFAKGKINKAITHLNQKTLTQDEVDYCENIISIIGEPILKRQLQKMLDSKRLSEVDQIKKQIQELQDELAKKEDKKDD